MEERIEAFIRSLDYDFAHLDIQEFRKFVEAYRRRPIALVGIDFQPELSAIWLTARNRDYVLFNNRLHPIQHTHNILHEFAHMLLKHDTFPLNEVLPANLIATLPPGSYVGRVRYIGRFLGDPQQEAEAETFVFLARRHQLERQRLDVWMGEGSSLPEFKSLADALGFVR